jgi:hypothetical protein
MNRSFRRCISVFSLLGFTALAYPALAQDGSAAEALFDRGLAHMEAGRYSAGCRAIAESQRLDPRPGTLFTLSQCEVRSGRLATAAKHLDEYLDLYERMTPEQKVRQSERLKVAKEQRDSLISDVPELTLCLPPGAPAGTVVKRDGVVLAHDALVIKLTVDPGEHVVSTQAPGGPLWEFGFTIAKGEKIPLLLEVEAAPSVKTQSGVVMAHEPVEEADLPPATKQGTSGRRIAAYASGGVGVAAVVLGGVMAGLKRGKNATIKTHCGSAIGASREDDCDLTGVDAKNSVNTLGLASTIGIAAGLAGMGTAAVLFLTEPKAAKPTTSARKPWIAADVLSVGLAGAMVGAHGSF